MTVRLNVGPAAPPRVNRGETAQRWVNFAARESAHVLSAVRRPPARYLLHLPVRGRLRPVASGPDYIFQVRAASLAPHPAARSSFSSDPSRGISFEMARRALIRALLALLFLRAFWPPSRVPSRWRVVNFGDRPSPPASSSLAGSSSRFAKSLPAAGGVSLPRGLAGNSVPNPASKPRYVMCAS